MGVVVILQLDTAAKLCCGNIALRKYDACLLFVRHQILVKHSLPNSQKTHCVCDVNTFQLMLYREIVAVCSEIHTKHINTLCGQNVVELLSVKPGGNWRFSPYRAVNTLRLGYKNQSVNAV
jgi:hypothetical protein